MSEKINFQTDASPEINQSRACELCWDQAFIESRYGLENQVEAYQRLLAENEGTPGHPTYVAQNAPPLLQGSHPKRPGEDVVALHD